jgi:hypothetical protein
VAVLAAAEAATSHAYVVLSLLIGARTEELSETQRPFPDHGRASDLCRDDRI